MSSYRKNLLVGIVVLGGLIVLGWMILQFADAPAKLFAPQRIKVQFISDNADGVDDGSVVFYRGVEVGKITKVHLASDNQRVLIEGLVDKERPLPANVDGAIRSGGLIGGGAAVHLVLRDEQPQGELKENTVIETTYVGMSLLPPDFALLARELRLTVQEFRESGLIASITTTSDEATTLIKSVNAIVGNDQVRSDVIAALHNIRTASDSAGELMANLQKFTGRLDGLADKADTTISAAGDAAVEARETLAQVKTSVKDTSTLLNERLIQLSGLLESFHSIAQKVDSGAGSAGQLVNDKRLYENLVETATTLSATVKDIERLVEQWEQEGVTLRLK
jgi:ABC-type transporter Mla subunit MlaD